MNTNQDSSSASVGSDSPNQSNETRGTCECSDPHCPFCAGHCRNWSNIVLNRCDMDDKTGVAFCEDCAEDAMDSGVFTNMDDSEDETSD